MIHFEPNCSALFGDSIVSSCVFFGPAFAQIRLIWFWVWTGSNVAQVALC